MMERPDIAAIEARLVASEASAGRMVDTNGTPYAFSNSNLTEWVIAREAVPFYEEARTDMRALLAYVAELEAAAANREVDNGTGNETASTGETGTAERCSGES